MTVSDETTPPTPRKRRRRSRRRPIAGLRARFEELEPVRGLAERVERHRHVSVGGLVGSSAALLLAALDGRRDGLRLVVVAGADEADAFAEDLSLFLADDTSVVAFPAFDSAKPSKRARESGRLSQRSAVVEALALGRGPRYVVAPLAALLQPVPAPDAVRRGSLHLAVGDELDLTEFGERLTSAGFHRVPMAETAGEWSVRGGIVDIYPRGRDLPVRIELFGDEIDSLRRFDPVSQRSVETLDECRVPILAMGAATGLPESDDPTTIRRALKRATMLTDLLPEDALLVHLEEDAAAAWLARFERARPEEELSGMYARFVLRTVDFANLRLTSSPVHPSDDAVNARLLTATGLAKDLVTFREATEALLDRNDSVRMFCGSEGEANRVRTMLREAGLADDARLAVEVGTLARGFQVPALRTALLSFDELFGRTRLARPPQLPTTTKSAPEWTELRIGDAVVHLDHGIGIYRGLEVLTKDGQEVENLVLEFDKGTRVYVPVTKSSLVHKFVGGGDGPPTLSTVGGKAWEKRKQRVADAVEGIAADLLRTQALRQSRPGISYPPDGPEQLEFEASFPFALTPDQESALVGIKRDMERDTPMDRLICGDVGFGKTELAVRAAFKAVMAGRQVAVLVPTTVLAEQHGEVFRERFAGYPLNVDVLCRFRTKKEQREILERARLGRVDVVIGTHRLVSPDVDFADLGLLVIDEEQRFGVQTKEALRHYRAVVDVLTLTATPIPRTLHMALLGLRDISSLTTPPFGRRPIETEVVLEDPEMIRDAFLRELERGGQVYYIHNRVQSIDKVARKLAHMVPEASYSVVHGQMPDGQIEERMQAFVDHDADVIVATTIVESGLDIPNANTIFIDRADRLGLADLHQLRGRVGRHQRRAYCYLIVPPGRLADDAELRVRAIEELSDLGAGFRIAMRDLEIRGAGSLLGAEQSGHIAAVGYELYCQLLADSVRRLRKDRVPFRVACHVNLGVQAGLPREYVPDDRQRIEVYRRLAASTEPQTVAEIEEECRDRFGPPPQELELIADLARIRIRGELLGITRISSIVFDGRPRVLLRAVDPRRVVRRLAHMGNRVRAVDKRNCHLVLPRRELDAAELVHAVLFALSPPPGTRD